VPRPSATHQVHGAPAVLTLTAAHHVSLDKATVVAGSSTTTLSVREALAALALEVPSLPPDAPELLEPESGTLEVPGVSGASVFQAPRPRSSERPAPTLRAGKFAVWVLAFRDSQVVLPALLTTEAKLPQAEYRLALFMRGVERLWGSIRVDTREEGRWPGTFMLTQKDVVLVPYDKSLTVTGLDSGQRYAVHARIADSKDAPAPAVVMIAGTSVGDEATVFERDTVVKGAFQLTFAVPVLDPSVVVPELQVDVTPL
jgi:hypothetical protein